MAPGGTAPMDSDTNLRVAQYAAFARSGRIPSHVPEKVARSAG